MIPLSRRLVLRGAAGAALALPTLTSLLPRTANAQSGGARAFIIIKSFSTQLVKEWYPAFAGNGYVLKNSRYQGSKADGTTLLTQPLVSGLPYTQAPLRDFQTPNGISGIFGPALTPFLDKLTLIRGLDFLPMVNHNYGALLGNFSSCTPATPCGADSLADVPTIDQVLAYSSKFYPSTPGLRALHVSQGVTNAMSYSNFGMAGAVQQLQARTNPRDAFNDAFGSFMPGPAGPGRDALLIDRVKQQYSQLKANPRLSAADRVLLDRYVTLVTELEARLSTTRQLACTAPSMPGSLANNQGTDPTDIATRWRLFLDVVAAAVMCGQTRLATIAVHKALGPGPNASDPTLFGHYHSEDASGGTWHGLAHDFGNTNARRMLKGINQWIASEIVGGLCRRLDVPSGNGRTFLDDSLIYWGNELGFNHIAYSVPCLLAGSAGGAIRPGRYLDYIDWNGRAYFSQEDGNVIKGIPHNRFLVSMLQAFGLSPADYERDGARGYGSTSTAGKDGTLWPIDYDASAFGSPLPGLS